MGASSVSYRHIFLVLIYICNGIMFRSNICCGNCVLWYIKTVEIISMKLLTITIYYHCLENKNCNSIFICNRIIPHGSDKQGWQKGGKYSYFPGWQEILVIPGKYW